MRWHGAEENWCANVEPLEFSSALISTAGQKPNLNQAWFFGSEET
jgi:hypothetical protein